MAAALPPGIDLCQISAMMPPPGVVPNFENPTTLAPAIISVSSLLTAVATVFVIGRIINNYQVRNIKIADCMLPPSPLKTRDHHHHTPAYIMVTYGTNSGKLDIIVLGWIGSVGYWISIMGRKFCPSCDPESQHPTKRPGKEHEP